MYFQICCSQDQDPELFTAIPLSYGTLGFLTAVDIDIIPYKPWIELTYHPTKSLDTLVELMTSFSGDPDYDSVEGIMFPLGFGIIMTGTFVDSVPKHGSVNQIGRWYKPWFFKHTETFLQRDPLESGTEYIPTKVSFIAFVKMTDNNSAFLSRTFSIVTTEVSSG